MGTAPFAYETENHYYSFASLTARALEAQYMVVARSGIGIFRNYNGPYDGNQETAMPALYKYTNYNDTPNYGTLANIRLMWCVSTWVPTTYRQEDITRPSCAKHMPRSCRI